MRGYGTVKKRGEGRWAARITIDGHELYKSFPSKELADGWLRQQRKVKVLGVSTAGGSDPDITFDQLAPLYLAWLPTSGRAYSARTLRSYQEQVAAVLKHFGGWRAAGLTTAALDGYVAELRRAGLSASSIRHRPDRISAMLKYAVRAGLIDREPCRVERPRMIPKSIPAATSDDEYTTLLDAAAKIADARVEVALALAGEAGIRASDIVRVRGRDADLDRSVLVVPVLGDESRPKGAAEIRVPISPRLRQAIERRAAKLDERLVPLTRFGLMKLLGRAFDRPVHLHALRRRFVTRLLDLSVPLPTVMQLAGHRTPSVTMRYHRGLADQHPAALAALGLIRAEPDKRKAKS